MSMEFILFLVVVIALAAWDAAEADHEEINDPLDLARPSVEHLQAEAERAFEELRALDRDERR